MNTRFNILTHQNWNQVRSLPGDSHIINYSKLKTIAFEQAFRAFSIKYVLSGQENYKVNGREHRVSSGEYLLTNPYCQGSGYIDSQSIVEGVCIDIQPAVIAEVIASLRDPGNPVIAFDTKALLESGDFFEYRFAAAQTRLGAFLNQFSHLISNDHLDLSLLNESFFYELAELYIRDYQQVFSQVTAIPALKSSTRIDLFHRVLRGKEYIDAQFTTAIDLPNIARNACLSEYHFYRLFKSVYNISPHQYILQKRLELGWDLLLSGHYSVTEAAQKTGFADIHSFSKSFRKRFGVPPSTCF